MIDANLIQSTEDALQCYRQATEKVSDPQAVEDYQRLVAITEALVAALRNDEVEKAHLKIFSFYRQVSDSFSHQPEEFKPLARLVADVEHLLP